MTVKRLVITLTAAMYLLLTNSCQPTTMPVKKSIIVTYSLLGAVVKDLVGDKANVVVSVPNGLDPHSWEPSAKDIEAIYKADLVIENGLGLEGGLEKTLALAKSRGIKFFTASNYINIRHMGLGEGIASTDTDQENGASDPHLWTDPLSMRRIVIALSPVLTTELNLDVSAQAVDLENRLDELNTEITLDVSVLSQDNRKLVTGHESLGYFALRYGFRLVGAIIPSISSQASVSASDLAGLKKLILDNQVKAIFTETGTSPAIAKAISYETGVKVVELSTHLLPADGSYFTFMKNLATIVTNTLK